VSAACNLCGGDRFAVLPFHYRWEETRFQGVRCRACGLVTLDPLPDDAQLRRLYDADYYADGLHGLDRLGTSYEAWADGQGESSRRFLRGELLRRRPGARRLFEVGAAMGHFLAAARDEGLEVAGLEISAAAVERAREKFGLDLRCADIAAFDAAPEAGRWDIVYAGDLFEHLRDPAGVVDRVHAMLAPGGLFALRVPGTLDLLSTRLALPLLRLAGRDRCLPDKPYHLYEYTTVTVRRMLARCFARVEVVSTATPPGRLNLKDRSAGYLAKYALQFVNRPVTAVTGRFGDRMSVYAWKD
jgi:SAM-dependent methyltransferase